MQYYFIELIAIYFLWTGGISETLSFLMNSDVRRLSIAIHNWQHYTNIKVKTDEPRLLTLFVRTNILEAFVMLIIFLVKKADKVILITKHWIKSSNMHQTEQTLKSEKQKKRRHEFCIDHFWMFSAGSMSPTCLWTNIDHWN